MKASLRRVLVVVLCMYTQQATPARVISIPVDKVLTFYYLASGEKADTSINISAISTESEDRYLLRMFSPGGSLLSWRYIEYGQWDSDDLEDLPSAIDLRFSGKFRGHKRVSILKDKYDLAEPGVYEMRFGTSSRKSRLKIEMPDSGAYCLSGQNGTLRSWDKRRNRYYFYIPNKAENLVLSGGPGKIRDETGKIVAHVDAKKRVHIPIGKTGVVWSFEADKGRREWKLNATGIPFALCPNKMSALTIQAGVSALTDGTGIAHEFQRRISTAIEWLLVPERIDSAENLTTSLDTRRAAWLKDPVKSRYLLKSFLPEVNDLIESQNVDPSSHWAGALTGWKRYSSQEPPNNRWDRWHDLEGLWAGLSSRDGSGAYGLAMAATMDDPVNPYFGRKALAYRAAAAALKDLMFLEEDETWPGIADLNPYPGFMAFPSGQKTFPVFGLIAQAMPANVRNAWQEGLRRIIDRHYIDRLVKARNQSSHYLTALAWFSKGSGDPVYQKLAWLYVKRWVKGMNPSGYYMEAGGVDGSYIGITHWHEAMAYRIGGDARLLDSLRKTYEFFNYTVAREPDGHLLGGFNFNHRVGSGFNREQWGGARGIVDGLIPMVAAVTNKGKSREASIGEIERFFEHPQVAKYPLIDTPRYLYFESKPLKGYLPAEEPERFFRDLGGELLAVKTSSYYAYLWIGRESDSKRKNLRRNAMGHGTAFEPKKGSHRRATRNVVPFVGGGLSGLWLPSTGHVLLSSNWSPTSRHGLLVRDENGTIYWEDGETHTYLVNADKNELRIEGKVRGVPLRYIREYKFGDSEIKVTLKLISDKHLKLKSVSEVISYPITTKTAIQAKVEGKKRKEGVISTDFVLLQNDSGPALSIRLDQPLYLSLHNKGESGLSDGSLRVGHIELQLPEEFIKGKTYRISYTLRPNENI